MPILFEIIPVTRFEQNCSVLWCSETHKAAVIDPGGDLWLIRDFLDSEHLQLEVILITHGHPDHAGGAAELAISTGARIEGPHLGDQPIIANLLQTAQQLKLKAQPFTPH